LGQHRRIALAGKDSVDDSQAGQTGDVTNHMVQLQIHLVERFLHVLNVRRCHLDKVVAVS
jgi:hypothetical protein